MSSDISCTRRTRFFASAQNDMPCPLDLKHPGIAPSTQWDSVVDLDVSGDDLARSRGPARQFLTQTPGHRRSFIGGQSLRIDR
jgi:hypothetical protein